MQAEEIAEVLGLSARTVRRELRAVYARLRKYPELRELLDAMASAEHRGTVGDQLESAAIDALGGNASAEDPDSPTWLTDRDRREVDEWTDQVVGLWRAGVGLVDAVDIVNRR